MSSQYSAEWKAEVMRNTKPELLDLFTNVARERDALYAAAADAKTLIEAVYKFRIDDDLPFNTVDYMAMDDVLEKLSEALKVELANLDGRKKADDLLTRLLATFFTVNDSGLDSPIDGTQVGDLDPELEAQLLEYIRGKEIKC